ncbi:MAG: hypothetical protein ACOYL5_18975 [Phototrophicaceae bacterium]
MRVSAFSVFTGFILTLVLATLTACGGGDPTPSNINPASTPTVAPSNPTVQPQGNSTATLIPTDVPISGTATLIPLDGGSRTTSTPIPADAVRSATSTPDNSDMPLGGG